MHVHDDVRPSNDVDNDSGIMIRIDTTMTVAQFAITFSILQR